MPLIEIHLLRSERPAELDQVAARINAEVATALGARPDATWTTWRTIDGHAVGPDVAHEQPAGSHPPIVHVYARRSTEQLEKLCDVVEAVLVEELGLEPGNVFITVQPVFAATELHSGEKHDRSSTGAAAVVPGRAS